MCSIGIRKGVQYDYEITASEVTQLQYASEFHCRLTHGLLCNARSLLHLF